jgi:hypothetical protein
VADTRNRMIGWFFATLLVVGLVLAHRGYL